MQHRCPAEKLDLVAEPLFGAHENAAAGQWCAVPSWRRRCERPLRQRGQFEPSFVERPADVELSERAAEHRVRQRQMQRVGRGGARTLAQRERLDEPTGAMQQQPGGVRDIRIGRRESRGMLRRRQSIVNTISESQCLGGVTPRDHIGDTQSCGGEKCIRGLHTITGDAIGLRQLCETVSACCIERDCANQFALRFCEACRAAQCDAVQCCDISIVRCQCDAGGVPLEARIGLPHLQRERAGFAFSEGAIAA